MMKADRIALDDFLDVNSSVHTTVLERIASGAVFVYPTETIYGIGGNGLVASVAQRVLVIKKRPPENPFILIASKQSCFTSMKPVYSDKISCLARCFWPGPLTLIVPCGDPPVDSALRVTDFPFVVAINNCFDFPLISTSANRSGEPYNPDPDAIYNLFCEDVDFMIDAGKLPDSKPSTVVKASSDSYVIIREGAIVKDALESVLNRE